MTVTPTWRKASSASVDNDLNGNREEPSEVELQGNQLSLCIVSSCGTTPNRHAAHSFERHHAGSGKLENAHTETSKTNLLVSVSVFSEAHSSSSIVGPALDNARSLKLSRRFPVENDQSRIRCFLFLVAWSSTCRNLDSKDVHFYWLTAPVTP